MTCLLRRPAGARPRAAASFRPHGAAAVAGLLMLSNAAFSPALAEAVAGLDDTPAQGPIRLAAVGDPLPPGDNAPPKAPVPPTPRLQSREAAQPERPAEPTGPLDNWKAFDAHFAACLEPVAGPEDATLTLRFAVDAKGRLRGTPVASYSKLPGSLADQKAFVAEALNSLANCLPLSLTPRFGPIVASRPLILRFLAPKPRQHGI